jgi:hypothetical protein
MKMAHFRREVAQLAQKPSVAQQISGKYFSKQFVSLVAAVHCEL